MIKEVIIVPKDKCPLRFIAEMEERVNNSWIFLHKNVLEKLISSADHHETDSPSLGKGSNYLFWEKSPSRELATRSGNIWFPVEIIIDNGINFIWQPVDDPEEILFLKMDD